MPCWSTTPLFLYFFYGQKIHTDEANDPFLHHLSLAEVISIQVCLLLVVVVLSCSFVEQLDKTVHQLFQIQSFRHYFYTTTSQLTVYSTRSSFTGMLLV
jgi:hypothetical protein